VAIVTQSVTGIKYRRISTNYHHLDLIGHQPGERFRLLGPSSGHWSILKTTRRSLNEVLYFAVLLDRCLMDIYSTSQYFRSWVPLFFLLYH